MESNRMWPGIRGFSGQDVAGVQEPAAMDEVVLYSTVLDIGWCTLRLRPAYAAMQLRRVRQPLVPSWTSIPRAGAGASVEPIAGKWEVPIGRGAG
jgi:hypothetical protein